MRVLLLLALGLLITCLAACPGESPEETPAAPSTPTEDPEGI